MTAATATTTRLRGRLVAAFVTTGVVTTGLVTTGLVTPGMAAGLRTELRPAPVVEQFSYTPIAMPPLPARHQNHCGYVNGHYVCADHCGHDYQVYFCPASASGCCHVGYGYCDAGGALRCMAPWYDFSSLIP